MGVNRDKPDSWKADIARSVDMYNEWFVNFAPKTYRATRIKTTEDVKNTLAITGNLVDIKTKILRENPSILQIPDDPGHGFHVIPAGDSI